MAQDERHELMMGGLGGQGVITIGYILAAAAMEKYKYITRFPIYLATMRGGPAYCTVIFSNEEIAAPILSKADNAIAMDAGSYSKFKKDFKKGMRLFVNTSMQKKVEVSGDYKTYEIPANDLAQEIGMPKMANMILLGVYCEVTRLFPEDRVLEALKKEMGGGDEANAEPVIKAFKKGVEFAREKKMI